jgi:hypothetical protein
MNTGNRTVVLIGIFPVLFISACSSTYFTPGESFEVRRYAPVSPTAVRVLRSIPNEPYQTLGDIRVVTAPFHDWETIIRKVRERAAIIGADEVFFKDAFSTGPGARLNDGRAEISSEEIDSVTFTAIRLLPLKLSSSATPADIAP